MQTPARFAIATAAALVLSSAVACDPSERLPARSTKPAPCPPPPEPAYQAVVVGTIGSMHMAESRYPLSRLGDVLTAFKPELVLVAVRVDAFREDRLEDASFEMTYVHHLARQHGAAVEPIDWWREQELRAAKTPADPWDAEEIAKREAAVLAQPRLYTFEQANGPELAQRIFLASAADGRYRAGDPLSARRHAWIQELTASAVARHSRPKRVLAYVDVFDRSLVDMTLHAVGYTTKAPPDVIAKSKEVMAGDVPSEVLAAYKAQLERVKDRAEKTKGSPEGAFWASRQQVLTVAIDKRATCCVTQSALGADAVR